MSFPASLRRQLAAWAIDLLFFSTVLSGLAQFADSWLFAFHWVWFVAFYLIRRFSAAVATTPGLSALSIDMHDRVPAVIARNEDLFSVVLPLGMLCTGCFILTRGGGGPVPPVLGMAGDPAAQSLVGLFLVVCAVALLRQLTPAKLLAGCFFVLTVLSVWASLPLLDAYIADMLVSNRVSGGFIARPEDVEMLQLLFRIFLFGLPLLSLAILFTPPARDRELAESAETEPAPPAMPRPFHEIPTDRPTCHDLPRRAHG